MSKSNIARQFVQVQPGSLHAGVDLALEKNVVVVINEKAQRLDHFSFPQDRGGYDYFLRRMEGLRQKHQAAKWCGHGTIQLFLEAFGQGIGGEKDTYHLVNAYTVKKHREGNQLDRSKDDRRDAGQIAELSRNGHYTETRLQKVAYEELRQYATLYDQLIQSFVGRKTFSGDWSGKFSLNYSKCSRIWKGRNIKLSWDLPRSTIRQLNIE